MARRVRKKDRKTRIPEQAESERDGGQGTSALLTEAYLKMSNNYFELVKMICQLKADYMILLEDHNRLVSECFKLRLRLKEREYVSLN